jgi:imidazolonepropionase-like amidohydrolase
MLVLTNARLFDGHTMLGGRHNVAVDGQTIAGIDRAIGAGDEVIDVDGMTLMPGLITGHFHPDFFRFIIEDGIEGRQQGKEMPPGVMMAIGVRNCGLLLENGFTGYLGASCTNDVDACLKIAIAEGIIKGPRLRACSPHINTTGDMNDARKWWQRHVTPGVDEFADGPDGLRKLVREHIRRGAETIKIFGSQGHAIPGRASRNMARDEIEMVVRTAHERNVIVRSHVCDREMIWENIELGVDILDHADEIDEACIEAMAKRGTAWVPSLFFLQQLIVCGFDEGSGYMQRIVDNIRKMLPIAQQADVKILMGDDYSGMLRGILGTDPLDHELGNYGREFANYGAIDGISAEDVLGWATRNPGTLLLDPPARTGVIAPGAKADLIVLDGDPLADLTIFTRPLEALKMVMLDGAMSIDRLPRQEKRTAA